MATILQGIPSQAAMKCLVVADLHYALKQLDWVQLAAEKLDLVVIAGDLLDLASMVDREAQTVVVLKYLERIARKAPLLVSSGNHDGTERNTADEAIARWLEEAREGGVLVDGDSWERDGTLFTIFPWWDGPVSREEVAQLLDKESKKTFKKWVWVYHAPPDNSRVSWTGKKHAGDTFLVDWIHQYKPALVLSGHIHQSPFRENGSWVDRVGETWVFNTGRQIGPEPAFIILDLEKNTAAWTSLAGREMIDLNDISAQPQEA